MLECSCGPVGLHVGPLPEGQEELSREPGGTRIPEPGLEAQRNYNPRSSSGRGSSEHPLEVPGREKPLLGISPSREN